MSRNVDELKMKTDHTVAKGSEKAGKADWAILFERLALPLAWLVLIIIFGAVRPDTFLSLSYFGTILGSQSVLLFVALGLIIVLRAGDFDLSVASTMALSSMIIAVLNVRHNVPIGYAILIAIAAGVLIGAVNGFFVVVLKIQSLIVTLGTATIIEGIILWISGSETITGVSQVLIDAVIVNRLFGIPYGFYYALLATAAVWYVFRFTAMGRRLVFVGRGRDVSRLSGISVGRVRWGALIAAGTFAAIGGALYAGTTGAADPTSGLSYLLPAFAAGFLGATTIQPGHFNAWGTLIAVYFLTTGINGLALLGIEVYVQSLFYGVALILAVSISHLIRSGKSEEIA